MIVEIDLIGTIEAIVATGVIAEIGGTAAIKVVAGDLSR